MVLYPSCECCKALSTDAPACPRCGALCQSPARTLGKVISAALAFLPTFGAVFFFGAMLAHGEDTGAVAAALKDEASECRYLLALCADAQHAAVNRSQSVERFQEAAQERLNLLRAAVVIRTKHDMRPSCFAECSMLNVDAPSSLETPSVEPGQREQLNGRSDPPPVLLSNAGWTMVATEADTAVSGPGSTHSPPMPAGAGST